MRWMPVTGYEGLYEVSDTGIVRRVGGKELSQATTEKGYRIVCLYRANKGKMARVHRLVLTAFVGPCPAGYETAHANRVRNDNALGNLMWKTHAANMADTVAHGTSQAGERSNFAKLTHAAVRRAKRLRLNGLSHQVIADKLGVTRRTIGRALTGKTWRVAERC